MNSLKEKINQACFNLSSGNLVVFPTETVYGLGADSEQVNAIEKIYVLKQRPKNHPLIVHIAPEGKLDYWADFVPREAYLLTEAFWPGPLTLILKRAVHINHIVTGGQDSIAVRCPSHPIAQELLRSFISGKANGQGGIAAPSANKFGRISPTRLEHVHDEFSSEIAMGISVLDGGATEFGIESTIVDLSRIQENYPPTLLRPGNITSKQISDTLGREILTVNESSVRSPGNYRHHYRPKTDLKLISTEQLNRAIDSQNGILLGKGKIAIVAYSSKPNNFTNKNLAWFSLPENPLSYGNKLYDILRILDQQEFSRIVLQIPPKNGSWEGIHDRLNRAGEHLFYQKK